MKILDVGSSNISDILYRSSNAVSNTVNLQILLNPYNWLSLSTDLCISAAEAKS